MKKNSSKKKQTRAAATMGPMYHNILCCMALFILLTSAASDSIGFFVSERLGISPGGALRISSDNGIENGLDVYKFYHSTKYSIITIFNNVQGEKIIYFITF